MTVPWHSRELTVGQVAARSGVAVSALHFYEAKGLIRAGRTTGNQRRYGRDTLRRIALIRVAQRVGIPLGAIREALAGLPEERTPTATDWAELSARWRTELDERIAMLTRLRDDFADCIGCGCLSLDRCKLANPLDRYGDEGPGPRRLGARSPTRPASGSGAALASGRAGEGGPGRRVAETVPVAAAGAAGIGRAGEG